MDTTVRRDVVTHIRAQHATIRRLFQEVEDASAADRGAVFQPLVRLLAVHETAEEMVVYPALAFSGTDAHAIVQARKAEEDRAKKTLAELEGMDASTAEFGRRLREFRAEVEAHADEEEREVLPLLEQARRAYELRAMDVGFVIAQAMAPTHAHRFAPESAVGNLLLGPPVALVDRVRDAVRDTRARRSSG